MPNAARCSAWLGGTSLAYLDPRLTVGDDAAILQSLQFDGEDKGSLGFLDLPWPRVSIFRLYHVSVRFVTLLKHQGKLFVMIFSGGMHGTIVFDAPSRLLNQIAQPHSVAFLCGIRPDAEVDLSFLIVD